MIQKWDVDAYPFDSQTLDINIYAVRSLKRFSFNPVQNEESMHNIENGWSYNNIITKPDSIKDFENGREYPALHYQIPLIRLNEWSLFFKLFLGMYAAVIAAFIAMFIIIIPSYEKYFVFRTNYLLQTSTN